MDNSASLRKTAHFRKNSEQAQGTRIARLVFRSDARPSLRPLWIAAQPFLHSPRTVHMPKVAKPRPLPGPARRDRARSPSLVRWLRAAARDPAAIEGTALGFGDLPTAARLQLVRPLLRDLETAFGDRPRDGARLIALILALETDREVAESLCRALAELDSAQPMASSPAAEAWVRGDDEAGCAALRLPGSGVLRMSWHGGVGTQLKLFHVPLEATQPPEPALRPTSVGEAVRLMSGPLIRYRRAGGELPDGVAAFARLF